MKDIFRSVSKDVPASIVVTLVALPLCLGIALASGASPFSGIIAGIAGGIVTGLLSGSQLSVSGPAAGLTTIVAAAIVRINVFEAFVLAVVLAGVFQIILGWIKAGIVGDYIPNTVIKGMMAAIGIILIMKQFPHLIGYDADFEGDESFFQPNNENTFTAITHALDFITPTAAIIGATSLIFLRIWEIPLIKKSRWMVLVPGPLVAVISGIFLHEILTKLLQWEALSDKQLVSLPVAENMSAFHSLFVFPQWQAVTNPQVWIAAVTIAIVASLETLLGIEAVDKIDPQKRFTPPNRELVAQGVGNILSGFFGGLPITSVVVRSSANVSAGAQTKLSTILHGFLLLLSVLFIPHLLNKIPLAALAAVLIFTGYKLAKVSLFREFYKKGWNQFIPFLVTIIAILLSDLLIGIIIGLLVGFYFILKNNFRTSVAFVSDGNNYLLRLRKDVSFLNKPIIKSRLDKIPSGAYVLIDASRADYIDKDIIDEINQFIGRAAISGIQVEIKKKNFNQYHRLLAEPEKDLQPEG
ncbi:MAG: SulP family inorganic anion transporter [Chitinophagaceae bacterium]|nr:SulP family inorganic anion transporter [Chitinophagaceae bacterium]MCA6512351.1 SulP family inorganic anion transporter [Chitinophagaceae bacterium]